MSLERLQYQDDGRVLYRGTRFHPGIGRDYQLVSGVEFLAMLLAHIALRYECRIHTYGALSTTIRRQFDWVDKKGQSTGAPTTDVLTAQEDSECVRLRRKNWARLMAIKQPHQDDVIERILRNRGLWDPPWRRERRARGPPRQKEFFHDGEDSQLPPVQEEDVSQEVPGANWDSDS